MLACSYAAKAVFNLLLSTAQYEFTLKEMFQGLLARKESKWNALKTEGTANTGSLHELKQDLCMAGTDVWMFGVDLFLCVQPATGWVSCRMSLAAPPP